MIVCVCVCFWHDIYSYYYLLTDFLELFVERSKFLSLRFSVLLLSVIDLDPFLKWNK